MRYLFMILSFFIFAHATNLLTYNIYERSDRVDIMLSFDSPYTERIFQKKSDDATILTLKNLNFSDDITKSINSKIVKELKIESLQNSTLITLKSDKKIGIIASKTVDGFGLRIRAKLTQTPAVSTLKTPTVSKTTLTDKKTKRLSGQNGVQIDYRYYLVLFVLFVLMIVLYIVKRKVAGGKALDHWLLKPTSAKESATILFQKPIDTKNKIVLLEFANTKYLIVSGNSNLLLDKFPKEKVKSQSEFEEVFEQNRKKLDDFLKLKEKKFDTYKDKASQDLISEYGQ